MKLTLLTLGFFALLAGVALASHQSVGLRQDSRYFKSGLEYAYNHTNTETNSDKNQFCEHLRAFTAKSFQSDDGEGSKRKWGSEGQDQAKKACVAWTLANDAAKKKGQGDVAGTSKLGSLCPKKASAWSSMSADEKADIAHTFSTQFGKISGFWTKTCAIIEGGSGDDGADTNTVSTAGDDSGLSSPIPTGDDSDASKEPPKGIKTPGGYKAPSGDDSGDNGGDSGSIDSDTETNNDSGKGAGKSQFCEHLRAFTAKSFQSDDGEGSKRKWGSKGQTQAMKACVAWTLANDAAKKKGQGDVAGTSKLGSLCPKKASAWSSMSADEKADIAHTFSTQFGKISGFWTKTCAIIEGGSGDDGADTNTASTAGDDSGLSSPIPTGDDSDASKEPPKGIKTPGGYKAPSGDDSGDNGGDSGSIDSDTETNNDSGKGAGKNQFCEHLRAFTAKSFQSDDGEGSKRKWGSKGQDQAKKACVAWTLANDAAKKKGQGDVAGTSKLGSLCPKKASAWSSMSADEKADIAHTFSTQFGKISGFWTKTCAIIEGGSGDN